MTPKDGIIRHQRTAPCVEVAKCGARGVLFAAAIKWVGCPLCIAATRSAAVAARKTFGQIARAKSKYWRENLLPARES